MATSFPGALDSFTNPAGTDALNAVAVPHAAQHTNANDAVEAIQSFILNRGPFINIPSPNNGAFATTVGTGANVDGTQFNRIVIRSAGTSGDNICARLKSAPSTPYKVTALVAPLLFERAYMGGGLCWRDSASGKLVTFGVNGTDAPRVDIAGNKWNSLTSWNDDYFARIYHLGAYVFLRIEDDGTNRKCSISADGTSWISMHTVGRTDYLTANEIGFYINTIQTSGTPTRTEMLMTVQGWKEE